MSRNAYWIPVVLVVALTATGIAFFSLAPRVGASWPFSITRADEGASPIMHDARLNLLVAAINEDPSPGAGGADIATAEGSALIAVTSPGGSSAYVESRGKKGAISTYTVEDGDSLSGIASRYGVSTNTILWANGLTNASSIRPGTELLILPVSGVRYTVKSGDTLAGVAKTYKGDADEIASYNGIGAELTEGTVLIIPGGELPEVKKEAAPAKKKAAMPAKKGSNASAKSLPSISGMFGNPVPGGKLSQGVHGYNGVDVAAPAGTPIYAAAAGSVTVVKSGGYNGGYGSYVVIDHGNGVQTLYAHMSSVAAGAGAVEKGAIIGYVGNTGKSTGNHLHFEVRGAKNPFAN